MAFKNGYRPIRFETVFRACGKYRGREIYGSVIDILIDMNEYGGSLK